MAFRKNSQPWIGFGNWVFLGLVGGAETGAVDKVFGGEDVGKSLCEVFGEKSARFWLMSTGISVNLEIYLLKTKPKQKSNKRINEHNSQEVCLATKKMLENPKSTM